MIDTNASLDDITASEGRGLEEENDNPFLGPEVKHPGSEDLVLPMPSGRGCYALPYEKVRQGYPFGMIKTENSFVLVLDLSLLDTERTFGSSQDLGQW